LVCGAYLLVGCNLLLGVEELKSSSDAGPAKRDDLPSSAADSGSPGQAGRAGRSGVQAGASGSGGRLGTDAGRTGAAGAAGTGGKAGPSSGGSGHAGSMAGVGAGSPGIAGAAGGGQGGSGGVAGNPGPDAGPDSGPPDAQTGAGSVIGTVIDYQRHVVPNVMVHIGDKTATTDSQGRFTIADAAATYDVALTINTSVRNIPTSIAWQVQGLTRRDPTLQVSRGLTDRFGSILMHASNVTFPLATNQRIITGWSGPDGNFTTELSSMDLEYLSPRWVGPTVSQGTAHALLFNFASPQDFPTEYTFDLAGAKLGSTMVSGSVTGSSLNTRINHVFLRFSDSTSLPLLDDYQAGASFSYVVPTVANAVIEVVAQDKLTGGGYAAAYADNVAPNQAGIALDIPSVPTLVAPAANKSNVDATTLFQWTGDAQVFLFCANSGFNYDALCVVTSKKETRLPVAPLSAIVPSANTSFSWTVETHGSFASVDEASGSEGFLSPYATEIISGPRRGSGSYAESASSSFTTTP
jgi:hypothetical protein